jgi:hypothetical protein
MGRRPLPYIGLPEMRRQLLPALSCVFLLACSGGPADGDSQSPRPASQIADSASILFEQSKLDLGDQQSGVTLDVVYPFRVENGEVRINTLEKSCGCLQPALYINGVFQTLPAFLPAGTTGEIRAKFATAGFQGLKRTNITVHGVGGGLPHVLHMQAQLERQFVLLPERLQPGAFLAKAEARHTVRVTAKEPFRLTSVIAAGVGIRIDGVPSDEAALEQFFEVVLLPDQEEGVHTHFVKIQTSINRPIILPVRYEKTGVVWLQPSSRLLLGAVRPGVAIEAAIDVGVREGRLEKPEVQVIGLEECTIDCVTLVNGSRYRVLLRRLLPADSPTGPLTGQLEFRLFHHIDGERREILRTLPVVGMVVSSK